MIVQVKLEGTKGRGVKIGVFRQICILETIKDMTIVTMENELVYDLSNGAVSHDLVRP